METEKRTHYSTVREESYCESWGMKLENKRE